MECVYTHTVTDSYVCVCVCVCVCVGGWTATVIIPCVCP